MRVAVLGASSNPARYSNKAIQMLRAHKHEVFPVHPLEQTIENLKVYRSLRELQGHNIHTLTVYVGPKNISGSIADIIALQPERVILNPGTESEELEDALQKAKIPFTHACTLVLLQTGAF